MDFICSSLTLLYLREQDKAPAHVAPVLWNSEHNSTTIKTLFWKEFQEIDCFTFSCKKVTKKKINHNLFTNMPTMHQVAASSFNKIYPSIRVIDKWTKMNCHLRYFISVIWNYGRLLTSSRIFYLRRHSLTCTNQDQYWICINSLKMLLGNFFYKSLVDIYCCIKKLSLCPKIV